MATKPLKDVAATVTSGGLPELSGSALSDANGDAQIVLRLSEPQYNQLMSLTVRGKKSGYEDGVGRIDTLPTYATAKANGLSMQILMQKYGSSQFDVSPMEIIVASGGVSSTVRYVNVTAPDSSWVIDASSLWAAGVTVTRPNNTTITVTCPAGTVQSTQLLGTLKVSWGSQTREVPVYRIAGSDTIEVPFTGTVYASGTSSPIANANVILRATNGTTGVTSDVASGKTDTNGAYTLTWIGGEDDWANLSQVTVYCSATGYSDYQTGDVGDVAIETAVNGIDVPNIYLTPAVSGTLSLSTDSVRFGYGETGVKTVKVNAPDANWVGYVDLGGTRTPLPYSDSYDTVIALNSTTIQITRSKGLNFGGYRTYGVDWGNQTKTFTVNTP